MVFPVCAPCAHSHHDHGIAHGVPGDDNDGHLRGRDGIIYLPQPVCMHLVYSCTSKSRGQNEYIGEFVVKHIDTEDYVLDKCDVSDDGENWARKCIELWTSAEDEKMQGFEAWQEQDAQRCEKGGKGG